MTYDETIRYLYEVAPLFQQQGAAAYKPGLDTTRLLDAHLGHPHRRYLTIHVAGTNGKGSCAHTLAAVLQAHGLRVGLYTSPHLVTFRERIRVNGEMIGEDYVTDFIARHRPFFEPLHPSFFELTTAMALNYFAESHVDVAVIEVGLGGRLDCTNIITPVLSLITNISLDHTQLLGDTLAKIALEKAGVMKPGIPTVIGEALPETRPVFEAAARRYGVSRLIFAEDHAEVTATAHEGDTLQYTTRHWGTVEGQLTGDCQPHNANTVLTALNLLAPHFGLTAEEVREGFRHVCDLTGLMGRWQVLSQRPTVVCDTGHNVGGWQYLSRRLTEETKRHACVRIVFGMVSDKDISAVMAMLPHEARYYWTQAGVKRALPATELARIAARDRLEGSAFPTVIEAYRQALAEAGPDDLIYVGGSSFIVADLLTALKQSPDPTKPA